MNKPIFILKAWIDVKKIDWDGLSKNPSPGAIKLLKQNPGNIDWSCLSLNTNPDAIELLKQNPGNTN